MKNLKLSTLEENYDFIINFIKNNTKIKPEHAVIQIMMFDNNKLFENLFFESIIELFVKSKKFRDLFDYDNDNLKLLVEILSDVNNEYYDIVFNKIKTDNIFLPKEDEEILINKLENNKIKGTIAYLINYDFENGNATIEINSEDYELYGLTVYYINGKYSYTDGFLTFDENYPTIIENLNKWLKFQ